MSTREPSSHQHPRSRSRSPDKHRRHHHHRDRDRSHRHHHRSHNHDRRERRPEPPAKPVILPFQARELSKRDLSTYEPMFAMYLDIQKGILIEDLSEDEVKGRWKSFINKWNRGELAEGWYDPSTLEKARRSAQDEPIASASGRHRRSPDYGRGEDGRADRREEGEDDNPDEDEDDYGPVLPKYDQLGRYDGGRAGQSSGPTIPTMQDLELRKESAIEDAMAAREDSWKQRRAEVRSHRSELRHMEDEVAPRAEPGTHERKMEKRQEAAAANRAFAESRRDELMGSADNDLDALKRAKATEQQKKNEREIRREEILRARAAEREERLQQYRQKEDETIDWLKALAKQRFG
ncbi:hypothetical protein ABOM_010412 [Aspergillus bombycis]|uniref:RNA helicase HEL117 n=1 Tax=Aspergillus bombycis TaxID=109264 RepID=A0A1F7ZPC7_9EURO|nr:hypothetical protein ABOM_010412 [Aspergillus bombycis]OGM41310.1 hypothetical protein ABOM_010412 [Aspergillus bombycis]